MCSMSCCLCGWHESNLKSCRRCLIQVFSTLWNNGNWNDFTNFFTFMNHQREMKCMHIRQKINHLIKLQLQKSSIDSQWIAQFLMSISREQTAGRLPRKQRNGKMSSFTSWSLNTLSRWGKRRTIACVGVFCWFCIMRTNQIFSHRTSSKLVAIFFLIHNLSSLSWAISCHRKISIIKSMVNGSHRSNLSRYNAMWELILSNLRNFLLFMISNSFLHLYTFFQFTLTTSPTQKVSHGRDDAACLCRQSLTRESHYRVCGFVAENAIIYQSAT